MTNEDWARLADAELTHDAETVRLEVAHFLECTDLHNAFGPGCPHCWKVA